MVRNPPLQCRGHRFDLWSRNYDLMCCGATQHMRLKERPQRTQHRPGLLPLRPNAATLKIKLKNKKQKSNRIMQMPSQTKPRGRKKMPFYEPRGEDSGNTGRLDPLLCSRVFTAVLHPPFRCSDFWLDLVSLSWGYIKDACSLEGKL